MSTELAMTSGLFCKGRGAASSLMEYKEGKHFTRCLTREQQRKIYSRLRMPGHRCRANGKFMRDEAVRLIMSAVDTSEGNLGVIMTCISGANFHSYAYGPRDSKKTKGEEAEIHRHRNGYFTI